jgi:transposase
MWYAGIDWANDHHDALVINEQGRQVGSLRVDHTPQGITRLNTFLEQIVGAESKEQMACIIETTHGLLIAHLLEAGWPVYPVNPRTVDRRRSASGAKTDTIDAYLLAKTGRADLADLHLCWLLGTSVRNNRRPVPLLSISPLALPAQRDACAKKIENGQAPAQ